MDDVNVDEVWYFEFLGFGAFGWIDSWFGSGSWRGGAERVFHILPISTAK